MRPFTCSWMPTSTVFPGSASSGRSSCNNTEVTELWRVYDLVPAVKWGGLLWAPLSQSWLHDCNVRLKTICSNNGERKICVGTWLWLLFLVSLKTPNGVYLSAHHITLWWDDAYFNQLETGWSLRGCYGCRKVFHRHMNIMLWLPRLCSHKKTMLEIDGSNIWKISHFLTQQALTELLPEEGTCCQRHLCANIFMALMETHISRGKK